MIAVLRYLPILAVLFAVSVFLSLDPGRIVELTIHWPSMCTSIVILYLVFWFRALTWWRFLRRSGVPVHFCRAVASRFITILTKYLPGKVWPILSMAAYIESERYAYRDSLVNVGTYQVAILVSGIGIGGIGILAILDAPVAWYPLPPAAILLAGALIDRPWFAARVIQPLSRRLGLSSVHHETPQLVLLLLACAVQWALMALAYWVMFASVSVHVAPTVILTQPLANVAGMLVPFTPAGLGVREAAAAGYLATATLDAGTALLYATLARAWSFFVEVLVFATGLVLNRPS